MKNTKISLSSFAVLVEGPIIGYASDKVVVASTADVAVTNAVPLLWVDGGGAKVNPCRSSGASQTARHV